MVPDPKEECEFPDVELVDEALTYEEQIVPDALEPQSFSRKGLADHIEVGSVYEVDRGKLPPTSPKVLQECVRVVLVTVKSQKSIKISYPTELLDPQFIPVTLPRMERFEMDLELAVQVLGRKIPWVEHIRKATLQTFWLVKSLQTVEDPPSVAEYVPEEDFVHKNGACISKDTCVGRKQSEENQTVKCVKEFEENKDAGHYISNSPVDLEMIKLKMKELSTDLNTEEGKRERSKFSIDAKKKGYRAPPDLDYIEEEKLHSVKYVETFEEDNDVSNSNSPSNIEVAKLESKEFSTDDTTVQGKQRRSKFSDDEQKNGYQVSHDVDANIAEVKINKVDDEPEAVSATSRKKRKACVASEKSKARKLGGRTRSETTKAGKSKAAAGKVDHDHGWWSSERYERARGALLDVMLAKNAVSRRNAICRKDLRNEALKRMGDTGLLDHVLKIERDKVAPDGVHRYRRWHDPEGNMKFWLESAHLFELREELGIQDPYWTPPPGWKPGDSTTSIKESICAATIKFLKEEIARENRSIKMQNQVAADDHDWLGAIDRDAFRQSPMVLKEIQGELLNRKAELEKELSVISESMRKYESALIKPSAEGSHCDFRMLVG